MTTDMTFMLLSLFFKMLIPLVIIGVIIFLVVTDTNKKKGNERAGETRKSEYR